MRPGLGQKALVKPVISVTMERPMKFVKPGNNDSDHHQWFRVRVEVLPSEAGEYSVPSAGAASSRSSPSASSVLSAFRP